MFTAGVTGSFYGFSIYSAAMKKQFNMTQQQLANINTIPYACGFLGPAAGLVTLRFGPAVGTLCGGIVQATGQMSMFLVSSKYIKVSNGPAALVGCGLITYTGVMLNSGACFSTPVQHYPRQRATVAALVKSFVGLSGAVVTQLFVVIYGTPGAEPAALKCLLLWAAVTLSGCTLSAALFPRRPDSSDTEPVELLRILFVLIAFLGFFTMSVSLLPPGSTLHDPGVGLMILLSLSTIPVMFSPCIDAPRPADTPEQIIAAESRRLAAAKRPKLVFESAKSYTVGEMLQTLEAWLILFVGVVVVGGGTILATNMAQIVDSAGASPHLVAALVSLFSIGNLLGRLLLMPLSDAIVRSGRSRADFLLAISALMGLSHIGLLLAAAAAQPASTPQAVLLVVSASAGGISFGGVWPHFLILASELFGSQHLSTNYSALAIQRRQCSARRP